MKYEVIKQHTSEDLKRVVNVYLQEGWIPIGGIYVMWDNHKIGQYFYQALIREEEKEEG